MVACAECGGELAVDAAALDLGEILICPGCGAELEVRRKSPLSLRPLSEDEDEGEGEDTGG